MKENNKIEISHLEIENENYYKISNHDEMRPFFMSIVSDSNHWMFISSNGGLSAGRKDAQNSLFPYYTDDKITESAEVTGSKSIFRIDRGETSIIWEPFSDRYDGFFKISRNLYKNSYGNKILFEEVNHDLELIFRYQWSSSNAFGFVRKSSLINNSANELKLSLIDGIQNILPYGVGSDLQNQSSNLVDAYKRSELIKDSSLGIYALSAIIVDKAEPSEALKANIAWSLGFENANYLVSSMQLKNFRKQLPVQEETDIKAEKGAYFINADIILSPKAKKEWMILADVNKNHSSIVKIAKEIKHNNQLEKIVKQDIENGTKHLIELIASSDGLQLTADKLRDTRHFSNSLFNIMRGGIFDDNYQIEKSDFIKYMSKANKDVFNVYENVINDLPEELSLSKLKESINKNHDLDFKRLCLEYMPLKFSRRHGDPSRPWNQFSINTNSEIDGSKILDYEGNWRDIFQNWEALAHSYPEFTESMIHKFLNATTFDGYNPYRVTKGGFDWEAIEPDNPWSYIGYWGDHQIIYLLKFLEFIELQSPGKLESYFGTDLFVYANVPYRIKEYKDILKNPKDTIEFDHESDKAIRNKRLLIGADAALLNNANKSIHRVNFIEKILATVLAKLSNFIPEGGIWMNTQRPEWNDANNALVGNGVSMVTLYYLRRFLKFFENLLFSSEMDQVEISSELKQCFDLIVVTFDKHKDLLLNEINDKDRKLILDGLGLAGSNYRLQIYQKAFSGKKNTLSIIELRHFIDISLQYIEHSIRANKRKDHLFHAYNLMTVSNENEISISYLSEMLEGQVAVLSSQMLSSAEALKLLDSLKQSKLFRPDQYSYLLYPNKQLPKFFEKNKISQEEVNESELLQELVQDGNPLIIEKDILGEYHFNGNFKNANDLKNAIEELSFTKYNKLAVKDKNKLLQIFEKVFNHKAFTGRSGTFYGYEGLGSIYWHMVSKLQLAVQECCLKAVKDHESDEQIGRLLEHYYEINEGIGVHKSPSLYGAFPTDPYSHTPAGKGAQQPGMTGQVKEDILSRFGELGVFVNEGKLYFNPCLLRKNEFLDKAQIFNYVNVNFEHRQIQIEARSLCFTYCQVPIIYKLGDEESVEIKNEDGTSKKFNLLSLNTELSKEVFGRTGKISEIIVSINSSKLK